MVDAEPTVRFGARFGAGFETTVGGLTFFRGTVAEDMSNP